MLWSFQAEAARLSKISSAPTFTEMKFTPFETQQKSLKFFGIDDLVVAGTTFAPNWKTHG